MTIPNCQDFMLSVLKAAAKRKVYISDAVKKMADEMHISHRGFSDFDQQKTAEFSKRSRPPLFRYIFFDT